MARLTAADYLIMQSCSPARPTYSQLQRQVTELEQDNAALLNELARCPNHAREYHTAKQAHSSA